MFGGSEFKRFSKDLDETVFALGGSLHYEIPRYRSPYATKVRVDKWCQKTGCFRTMGPPRSLQNPPHCFLKKHSRQSPVFFDPDNLKEIGIRKGSEEADILEHDKKNDADKKARQSYNLINDFRPPAHKPCKYPLPPNDMGIFRSNSEVNYEKRYRKRVFEKCCNNAHPNCFCTFPEDKSNPKNKFQTQEQAHTKDKMTERPATGGNGPVQKIGWERRDFLRENALKVIRTPAKRTVKCYLDESGRHKLDPREGPFVLKSGFGEIPKYIQKRKMELYYEYLALKGEVDGRGCQGDQFQSNCRALSEVECEIILQGLTEHWNELNESYLRLPTYPSDRAVREKEELEQKLGEIEKDIKLFHSSQNIIVSDLLEPLGSQDI